MKTFVVTHQLSMSPSKYSLQANYLSSQRYHKQITEKILYCFQKKVIDTSAYYPLKSTDGENYIAQVPPAEHKIDLQSEMPDQKQYNNNKKTKKKKKISDVAGPCVKVEPKTHFANERTFLQV